MSAQRHLVKLLGEIQNSSRVILWGDWCTTPALDDGIVDKHYQNLIRIFPIAAKNPCDRDSDKRVFSWSTPNKEYIQ